MRHRYLPIFITFLLVSLFAEAKEVDFAKAENIARLFHTYLYQSDASHQSITCELTYTGKPLTRSSTSVPYYVFNFDAGFVIVAGDDLSTPILAYSPSQRFVSENMPSNLSYWLDWYREQISLLQSSATSSTHPAWDNLDTALATTIDATDSQLYNTALWYQYAPYNKYCPTVNGDGTATGCVATAFSIAMKYRQWPDKGTGSYSYEWNKETLSANFDVTYQWDDMLLTYETGKYTDTQGDAVATLMYHIGVLSNMDYGTGGSGAYTIDAVKGVAKYMKYDKSIIRLNRSWYLLDEWIGMLKKEIDDNGPMVYGGYDTAEGGHQFILDGYRNDYFHVNWGWAGSSDGYYLVTDLNPFDREATSGGFASEQGGVFNLKPETANSSYTYLWVFGEDDINNVSYAGLKSTTTDFKIDTEFNVAAGVYFNQSLTSFTGDMCIMLCDNTGSPKEDVSGLYSISDFPEGEGSFHTFVCKIQQPIAIGDYICLMYKTSGSDTWKMVIGGSGITSKIYVDGSTTGIPSSAIDTPSIVVSGSAIYIESPSDITDISLYSATGMLTQRISGLSSAKASITIDHLGTGIYILEIKTISGVFTHKVVVH